MSKLPDYHGPHPRPAAPGVPELEWRAPQRHRVARVRIVRHTCECASVVYEFCRAGGLAFLRRTIREQDRIAAVHETRWGTSAETERLWDRVLLGGGQ